MAHKAFIRVAGSMLMICMLLAVANPARAELSKKELAKLQNSLREAAQKFGDAYVKRDFRVMYQMLNDEYRQRVPLWEYKDFVHYDGISDGFMKVIIMDVVVLPPKKNDKLIYGKVGQKISSVENLKAKTTGKAVKSKAEFIYWDDWVRKNGTWYKIEKIE
jgi:nitrate/nitrite-specific signal transduction histidine kinase